MSTLADAFFTRLWWTVDVRRESGGIQLLPRPGVRRVVLWRSSLGTFLDEIQPEAMLHAKAGDRFIACGSSIDETLLAIVDGIDPRGSLLVTLAGEIAASTVTLQLLAVNRSLRSKSPSRRGKRTASTAPSASSSRITSQRHVTSPGDSTP